MPFWIGNGSRGGIRSFRCRWSWRIRRRRRSGRRFRGLALQLRRRQRLPGLLGVILPRHQLFPQLRDLLLKLGQGSSRRLAWRRLVLRRLGCRAIDKSLPLFPRQAQIRIRLPVKGQTEQEQPGGCGHC